MVYIMLFLIVEVVHAYLGIILYIGWFFRLRLMLTLSFLHNNGR